MTIQFEGMEEWRNETYYSIINVLLVATIFSKPWIRVV
jgi:hypothetical protein